jgi:hypothetical protein
VPDVRESFERPLTLNGSLVTEFEASADIRVGRGLGQDRLIDIEKLRRGDMDGDRLLPESGEMGVGSNSPRPIREAFDEMAYHRVIFGFLDDVPSLLDGGRVSHEPSRDSFFRLLEFGVDKRHKMGEGRQRDVCGAGPGRRC